MSIPWSRLPKVMPGLPRTSLGISSGTSHRGNSRWSRMIRPLCRTMAVCITSSSRSIGSIMALSLRTRLWAVWTRTKASSLIAWSINCSRRGSSIFSQTSIRWPIRHRPDHHGFSRIKMRLRNQRAASSTELRKLYRIIRIFSQLQPSSFQGTMTVIRCST